MSPSIPPERGFQLRYTPSPSGFSADFYRHCAGGELRFQRCSACRTWRHPPRVTCGRCSSEEWAWEASSGRGTLFSWTVTHQALAPGFAEDVPYAIVVVELAEGLRLVSGLRGIAPEDLELGMPLVVEFVPVSDAIALHCFRRA
ncbi:MAG: hypothetical protein FJ148_19055 [Deltaproteobacteria bacterium]|nr:hypothetical protein [Deltaproteobacteria bacterium]